MIFASVIYPLGYFLQWAMDGFNALFFNSGVLEDVIVPVLVLLGLSVMPFIIGFSRFRYE